MAKIRRERVLPFDGKVLANIGDAVDPETVIAEMRYVGERPFIVDVSNPLKIPNDEIKEYMNFKIGDRINTGDIVAERHKMATRLVVKSPVSGKLEYISEASGKIVIRELVDEKSIGPYDVDCANELEIPPENLKFHLEKELNYMVEKEGIIASRPMYGGFQKKCCRSPIFGEIIAVNLDKGIVTVKRPVEEIKLKSIFPGIVKQIIKNRGAIIETEGELQKGVFGFGGLTSGILGSEILLLEETLRRDYFEDVKKDIKGIIAPSILIKEFRDLFGIEIAKGITGKNDTGVTIILTEGFGEMSMNKDFFNELSKYKYNLVVIDGKTQIRAGSIRPEIIIPV